MPTVIECGSMIDARRGEAVPNATVVIDGKHIQYAGPSSGAPSYGDDAHVVRVPTGTVMPGLIDVHVHITSDGGDPRKGRRRSAAPSFAEAALRGAANAHRSLKAGYTTLRDVHAPGYVDIPLRNIIEEGRLDGSRLRVCGQGLCITGGHMDKMVLPSHMSVTGRVGVGDSPSDFRRAVRQHVKMGVDLIKINSDGGSMKDPDAPWKQEMTYEEMEAACSEAHRFGLHVAAHTSGGPPIEDALRAGVDTIEHGHWLTDRAIELFLERGAYYVPTLIVNTRNFDYDMETLGATAETWAWLQAAYDAKWGSLERARKAGVKIAAGSDAGFLVDHGENAAELEEMVKGGMTPMAAIQAATTTNAELLALDDRVGTLEAGMLADVIVVDGDPLVDITVLQQLDRITHVFKEGRSAKSPVA